MSPPPEDAILTVIRGQDRRVSDTMIPQDTACAIHSGLVCGSSSTRPSGCRIKRPHCLDVWPEAKTARSDLVHVVPARLLTPDDLSGTLDRVGVPMAGLDPVCQAAGQFGVSSSSGQFGVSSWDNSVSVHHYCFPWGQFGVSSSLLLPLHQVGKLDSWEDFQDRQAMTLFTTRSTAGTTEPMSSAPRANGICSLAISPAPRHGTLSRSSATA